MRTIPLLSIPFAALASCTPPPAGTAPRPAGCSGATTVAEALSPVAAGAAGFLPAGLYFRDGYLRGVVAEAGFPEPTHAVVLGPFETPEAASEAIASIDASVLPSGYPTAFTSDELQLLHASGQEGLFVVVGLYAGEGTADAWLAGHGPAGARVEPLADAETAFTRLWTAERGDEEGSGPRFVAVRIAPGADVPAYPRAAIEAAEDAYFNWSDEAGRGPDPVASPPVEPLCTVEPGTVFVARDREMWRTAYRWAPASCGGEPAYVPWLATTLYGVVVPDGDRGYRMIQVGGVECDSACFCEWPLDGRGARVVDGAIEDACACPPSCGYGGCS